MRKNHKFEIQLCEQRWQKSGVESDRSGSLGTAGRINDQGNCNSPLELEGHYSELSLRETSLKEALLTVAVR